MNESLPMDRVGIDGLSGPGRKGRRAMAKQKKEQEQQEATRCDATTIPRRAENTRSRSDFLGPSQTSRRHNNRRKSDPSIPQSAQQAAFLQQAIAQEDIYTLTGEEDPFPGVMRSQRGLTQECCLGIVDGLKRQGFSHGLAQALAVNAKEFDHRIWIVDNSGSMQIGDGHKIVTTSDRKIVAQTVTRWEEIQDTVMHHCDVSALLDSPTTFKLLNHPGPGFHQQEFRVSGRESRGANWRTARNIMTSSGPIGTTPLTKHIWDIHHEIHRETARLRRLKKRVVVVLATDGLPTDDEGYGGPEIDEEFVSALRALEGLPIWMVIRLCTDEARVTQYYNKLDAVVNLPLEVLDDFMGEAKEVHRHNKWLNYSLPMHRCRELGYHDRLFDLLDERALTTGELRMFCKLLFGTPVANIPDPNVAWKDFLKYIQDRLLLEEEQWDPMKKKKGPWIYLKTLHRVYGKGGKCIIM